MKMYKESISRYEWEFSIRKEKNTQFNNDFKRVVCVNRNTAWDEVRWYSQKHGRITKRQEIITKILREERINLRSTIVKK